MLPAYFLIAAPAACLGSFLDMPASFGESLMSHFAGVSSKTLTVDGFEQSLFSKSAGGHADCVEGTVKVAAKAVNRKINLAAPKDNPTLTQLIRDLFSPSSGIGAIIDGGENPVSGVFDIYSKLCVPVGEEKANATKTIHFLTHGGTLDLSYWDFQQNYSYVDQAAARGFATFSYDRLGTGRSDHPDGIHVTQGPLQVEIAHTLVTMLQDGKIANRSFETVVGVAHSAGAAITQGVAKAYPKDFAALVLSGHSAHFSTVPLGMASTALQIANTESDRFKGLDNGYVTPAPVPQSLRFAFFQYPEYEEAMFDRVFRERQTNSLGETTTLGALYAPAPDFDGPVAIMNGKHDFFFCGDDCLQPESLLPEDLSFFFPAAAKTSTTAVFEKVGHNINFHKTAQKAIDQMLDFIEHVGIKA